ncbi:hypothetical protein BRAO375_1340002 [Bradyrhizobium sp. ORS 375]|nr:hypothetical protein BRAO375_1340002 [Bradyrhizobium sp. ORS 375]
MLSACAARGDAQHLDAEIVFDRDQKKQHVVIRTGNAKGSLRFYAGREGDSVRTKLSVALGEIAEIRLIDAERFNSPRTLHPTRTSD